jgi:hypothetical protein
MLETVQSMSLLAIMEIVGPARQSLGELQRPVAIAAQ